MGNESNVKILRKQIRNVAQESFPEIMTKEMIQTGLAALHELIGQKLDVIAASTEKEVKKIDQQTQVFRSMVMRDLGSQMSHELSNMSITMLAWQKALTARLNFQDMEAFEAEVAGEKEKIAAELRAEAEAQAKANAEAAKLAKAQEEAAKAQATPDAAGDPGNDQTNFVKGQTAFADSPEDLANGNFSLTPPDAPAESTGTAVVKSVDQESKTITAESKES